MQTASITSERDALRDDISQEFSYTVHEIERALKQIRYQWNAFNEAGDSEKALHVHFACGEIRRMISRIDIFDLADLSARFDVVVGYDE